VLVNGAAGPGYRDGAAIAALGQAAGDVTALAFIIGVMPLVIATGAGAGARRSIGTTLFGGMSLASFMGVLFIAPVFILAKNIIKRLILRDNLSIKKTDSHVDPMLEAP
jgi:hypothetical protein